MSNFRHFFPILDTVVQYLTVLLAFGHCCPIFDSITCFWTLLSNIWQYYLLLDTVVQYLTVLLAFGHYCPIFDSITCFWTLLSNIWQYYLLLDTIVQILDSIFWLRAVLSGFWKLLPRFVRFNISRLRNRWTGELWQNRSPIIHHVCVSPSTTPERNTKVINIKEMITN